jgi:hypothetical protein
MQKLRHLLKKLYFAMLFVNGMGSKEIIVKVNNSGIYLNPALKLDFSQTNLPKEHFSFKKEYYWVADMLWFDTDEMELVLQVSDFNATDIIPFENQKPKKEIHKLRFQKLNWEQLEPQLSYFQLSKLQPILEEIEEDGQEPEFVRKQREQLLKSITGEFEKPGKDREVIEEKFWAEFSEASFKLGYISITRHIKSLGRKLQFQIYNDEILPEFEHIKFWFSKKLQSRRFEVMARIILQGGEVLETHASSKHIDKISSELVDSIRFQRTYALTKATIASQPDKSLFTADDIFQQGNTEDLEGNVFRQSELDILQILSEKYSVRNRKQLEYLAGKKQSPGQKIRYTLSPNFGFLFFIEGEKMNHFVWELLNSHATYIWSIEKGEATIQAQFKRIESIINNIRTMGRENYKKAFRQNLQDNDLVFKVITHKHTGSDFVDDFPKWKARLNEHLV